MQNRLRCSFLYFPYRGRANQAKQLSPARFSLITAMSTLNIPIQVAVDERTGENGLYILTGSHQPALRSDVGQSLAGRVGGLTLLPLSLVELLAAGIRSERERRRVEGFMPRLFSERQSSVELYRNYAATYLEKDVS